MRVARKLKVGPFFFVRRETSAGAEIYGLRWPTYRQLLALSVHQFYCHMLSYSFIPAIFSGTCVGQDNYPYLLEAALQRKQERISKNIHGE